MADIGSTSVEQYSRQSRRAAAKTVAPPAAMAERIIAIAVRSTGLISWKNASGRQAHSAALARTGMANRRISAWPSQPLFIRRL